MTRLEKLEQAGKAKNTVARCRPLLEMGLFRDDSPANALVDVLRRGTVLDLHQIGLETLQLAAGAFVLRKLYKDMFQWGETDRLRLAIVLDEAHRLARDVTLPKIMKEGRKFGLVLMVASQGLDDFHPDVLNNAPNRIVFRTNYPMSKKVAGFVRVAGRNVDMAARIEKLDVGRAYVQGPEMAYAVDTRMLASATAE